MANKGAGDGVTRREAVRLLGAGGAGIAAGLPAAAPLHGSAHSSFLDPPDEARPWVYWYFMDGHVSREGMIDDLEAMQRAGIGGAIYLEVGLGLPPGPVRFMSEAWQSNVANAFLRAEALGLEMALAAGPGWCGTGGPWVKPEESMQYLVGSETRLKGPARFDGCLVQPPPRPPFFGEASLKPEHLIAPELAARWPEAQKTALGDAYAALRKVYSEFYADELVLAFPAPAGNAQIPDHHEKALYIRGTFSSQELFSSPFIERPWTRPFLGRDANYPSLPPDQTIAPRRVIDLTGRMDADGRLTWDVPSGEWIVVRLGRTLTGQTSRPAPIPGTGLESDKFSRAALDHHLRNYTDKILKRIGGGSHRGKGLTALHFDSWEMGSQNWTATMREEFRKRRGYDLLPYLPSFNGHVVESLEVSDRFLWDFRQTAQELVVENHLQRLGDYAHENALNLSVEPYDLNPTSDLLLAASADVPMCEFWSTDNSDYSVAEAVSIAHTNGRSIVGAEAFTGSFDELWHHHPGSLKAQTDWAFCAGVNRICIHRFQAQPRGGGAPGMTMGPKGGYGVHWDRTQTWWDMVPAYHRYIARCQYMLRRGLPVADVLYLAAEGAPHVFLAPRSAFLPGTLADRRGHDFDGCAPETLITRASVKGGRIVFPDGMGYRLLVLPRIATMTPGLLRKVTALVEAGADVLGLPPRTSPSLVGFPECDDEVRRLAGKLWGKAPSAQPRRFGLGRVWWDDPTPPGNPLAGARWLWTDESEAEASTARIRTFVREFDLADAARLRQAEAILTASPGFRLSVNRREVGSAAHFAGVNRFDVTGLLVAGRNRVEIEVSLASSALKAPPGIIAAVEMRFDDGRRRVITSDAGWTVTRPDGESMWKVRDKGPFTAAPWSLGDTSLEEASLYPAYRDTAALLAKLGVAPDFEGDEDVRFIHRRIGTEDIFFIGNRRDDPVVRTCAFRVTGKRPEWWDPMTGERRALPEFEERDGRTLVPLRFEPRQSGFMVFGAPDAAKPTGTRNFVEPRVVEAIERPWTVEFDRRWGGPGAVVFPRLEDWTAHSDPGVRHYSGKARYRTRFAWSGSGGGGRLALALGKVCNIASVRLNGHDLGIVWSEPWRLEIPRHALRQGENELVITVANLWLNRLIGDKPLPPDKRVTWTPDELPLDSKTPLLASGLLGPVRILALD